MVCTYNNQVQISKENKPFHNKSGEIVNIYESDHR